MMFGLDLKDERLMVMALVLAFGVLGVIAIPALMIPQQAEAASTVGQCASAFRNASSSLCHTIR